MTYEYASSVFGNVVEGHLVIADLNRGVFLALSEGETNLLEKELEDNTSDGAIPILSSLLRGCYVLQNSGGRSLSFTGSLGLPSPTSRVLPSINRGNSIFSISDTVVVGRLSFRARRVLSGSLNIERLSTPLLKPTSTSKSESLEEICLRFLWASVKFFGADDCFPRSLALRDFLRRNGLASKLVIGVRVNPLAAHAWVQIKNTVVLEDLHLVRGLAPVVAI